MSHFPNSFPPTPLSPANGGTGNDGGAWASEAVFVAPSTGAFTTATAVTRWRKIGRTVFFTTQVTITTNGTAAGGIVVALPTGITAGSSACGGGREVAATGNAITWTISIGGTSAALFTPTNTYPGGTGYTLTFTGVFEASA